MKATIHLAFLLFAFAVAAPSLRAAETAGLTLDQLVSEALAKNPELKFYEAEIAAARGQRRQTGTLPNPELSAELGSKRVEDLAGNKLGDGPVWAVSVAQTFEFPGRVSLRKAIAGKQIELAQLGLEQFRTALANQVRLLGYRAMVAMFAPRSWFNQPTLFHARSITIWRYNGVNIHL